MSDEPSERSYYLRLMSMYMDLGTETVLAVFIKHSPNNDPEAFIKSQEAKLLQLQRSKILNKQESNLLFTDKTDGQEQHVKNTIDVKAFDIALLITLSQNLFNDEQLQPPKKGWQNPPRNSDNSIAADLFRLRTKRNVIVGHYPKAMMTNIRFDQEWKEITEILVRIHSQLPSESGKNIKERIDVYREQKLDPTVENKYDAKLKEWLEEINRTQNVV